MALKKTSARGHGTLNELNITPLLDLVFVLLVIFIITTPQMINSLEMNLPSGKPPPPNPHQVKPKINRVTVEASGKVFLNGQPVADADIHQAFAALKSADPDPKVVVKGDDDVNYQGMVKVLDALQQLGITKVGLATQ